MELSGFSSLTLSHLIIQAISKGITVSNFHFRIIIVLIAFLISSIIIIYNYRNVSISIPIQASKTHITVGNNNAYIETVEPDLKKMKVFVKVHEPIKPPIIKPIKPTPK